MDRCRLFIYGSMLRGQPDHALLAGAEWIGEARTEPAFSLVDLGVYAAMVPGGSIAVHGELYTIDLATRAEIDRRREVPVLFQRARVRLVETEDAETYVMSSDQVRGKRRLRHGDWRHRFAGPPRPEPGAFVRWARGRFPKG